MASATFSRLLKLERRRAELEIQMGQLEAEIREINSSDDSLSEEEFITLLREVVAIRDELGATGNCTKFRNAVNSS
jgi:hypothetical protein